MEMLLLIKKEKRRDSDARVPVWKLRQIVVRYRGEIDYEWDGEQGTHSVEVEIESGQGPALLWPPNV